MTWTTPPTVQALRRWLTRLLIEPRPASPMPLTDWRYSRLLATILLIFIPAGSFVAIAPAFTDPNYNFTSDIGFWPSVISMTGFTIAYLLNRRGHYRTAIRLTILIMIGASFLLAIADTSGTYIGILSFLFVPVLLASYMMSSTWTIGMGIASLVAMLILPLFFSHIPLETILNGPFSISLIVFVLVGPMTYYREKWQQASEQQLNESQQQFRQMVEHYPDMVTVEQDGRYIYVNQAGVRLLGATYASEIKDKPVSDFLPADSSREIAARMVRQQTGGEMVYHSEEQITRLDGVVLDVEVETMPTTVNGKLATQKFIRPVTQTSSAPPNTPYRQVVESVHEMVLFLDARSVITYMNTHATVRLGYQVGQSIQSITAPDSPSYDLPRLPQASDDAISRTARIETKFIDKSGRPLPVSLRYLKDNMGSGGGIIIATDQTKAQQNQVNIEQGEERFAHIFNSNVIGIAIVTLEEGRFVAINDYFLSRIGYTREQVIGSTSIELGMFPVETENSYTARQRLIEALKANGTIHNYRYQMQTAGGDLINVHSNLELITLGGEPHILTLMQDITDEIEIKRALTEAETRYRAVTNLMTDYAYYLNINERGRLQLAWITGAFTQITGYTPEEASQWDDWKQIVHPDDIPVVQQHLKQIIKGNAAQVEYRVQTRDGATRWIHQSDRPVTTENGSRHVSGIYGTCQDITSRMEAENALRDHALQQAVVAELGQRALERGIDSSVLHEEAVRLTAHVLNTDTCLLMLVDESANALRLVSSVLPDPSASTRINEQIPLDDDTNQAVYTLLQGEPVVIEDHTTETRFPNCKIVRDFDIRSSASVAIHGHESRLLGVLVAHSTAPAFFSVEDVSYLQAIANVLAAYQEQKAAEHAEREQRIIAEALRDTAALLNSTLDLDTLLDHLLNNLGLIAPYDSASVMLMQPDGSMKIIRHRGFDKFGINDTTLMDVTIPANNVKINNMIEQNGMMFIRDVREEPDWFLVAGTEFIRSYVGALIQAHGQVLGIINMDSATPNAFTAEHADRLLVLANQAAIAITNARRAEELEQRVRERTDELNIEHHRLQTILDASGEGIFYTEDLCIGYANQMFYTLTGFDASSLLDRTPADLMAPDLDEKQRIDWDDIHTRLAKEPVIRHETCLQRADGSVFDAGLTISRYGQHDGIVQMVVIVRDISQAKQLEKQKSRFIADASHELRTPLASLNMRLYMLRRNPERREANIAHLERGIERMSTLVEDMLNLSRFENGVIPLHYVDVIVQTLIIDVLEMQQSRADEKTIRVTHSLIEDPVHVFADPDRIRQVLNNLVGNAINYTEDGGSVHVAMQLHEDWVLVQVEDNGLGISKEDLDHIFQPFYRSNKDIPGTGLGLSISNEIIEQHGGKITVESELGCGSTFTMWLRLSHTPKLGD